MKIIISVLFLLMAGSIGGCSSGIPGSGNLKSEPRNVTSFNSLSISGAYDFKVDCGKTQQSVEIKADDNLLPLITTQVVDGVLEFSNTESISPTTAIQVTITVGDLKSVNLSGAGKLAFTGLKNKEFKVHVSGAGEIACTGETDNFEAELSGAGKINAKDLVAKVVSIEMSGAAKAEITASEELNADISGVGSIDYYGNPAKVNPKISGIGKLNRK